MNLVNSQLGQMPLISAPFDLISAPDTFIQPYTIIVSKLQPVYQYMLFATKIDFKSQ